MPTNFPKPWTIEELPIAYVVKDAVGTPLAYLYWNSSTLVGTTTERPSKEQALVLARAFARLGQ